MLFGHYDRYQYAKSPLVEVICQLRFPTILSIGSQEPAAFQEAIRREFPRYAVRQEQPAPRVVGAGGPAPKLEAQPPVTNYNFVSADGLWKLNLTKDFIALSTLGYHCWEDFAQRLDKPLASFIQLYQPAFLSASVCGTSTPSPARPWGWRTSLGSPSSSPPSWGSWPSWTWTSRRPAAPRWTPTWPFQKASV